MVRTLMTVLKISLRLLTGLAALTALASPSFSFEADGCEKQRAQYPKRWNDVSKEKALFNCAASDGSRLNVRLGASDGNGRTLISVTATPNGAAEDQPQGVFRMGLDRDQTERIKKAEYFATVVRSEKACWIRSIDHETVAFFMDQTPSVHPVDDSISRVSLFGQTAYTCAKSDAPAPAPSKASCDEQRAQFPGNWPDVSKEKPLFTCQQRGESWRLRLGEPAADGRSMMSLVNMRWIEQEQARREDPSSEVHRTWLDAEQVRRLKEGRYFATVMRGEDACWSGGTLKDGQLFFMDAAEPPQDRKDAGNLYNKAPRLGVFGQPMHCEPFTAADR
jgi:hypothetical protein